MNLLGALGAVSRTLPGYMQGYRMAVQDNWNDLNQYNQVWKGQLSNLFDEATFTPAVDMFNANAGIAGLNALNTGLSTYLNFANAPASLTQAALSGAYALPLGSTMKQAQMRLAANMGAGGGMGGIGGMNFEGLAAILRQAGYNVTAPQAPGQQPSGVQ